ncbi:hypothetical protein AUC47_04365 [Microbacterium sp. SZ1]|nr:hypothetical protein AUC47_04365 [Microbacterium sp. SZ1]
MAALRLSVGAAAIALLGWTYVIGIPRGGANPFDYFGYFTNLTTLMTSMILITVALVGLRGRTAPAWLSTARGVAVTCTIVVGLVYNILVPGTGSAPAWVSVILHTVMPLFVVVDWTSIGDRPPLPWRRLWLVLPYPVLWLVVVLVRGVTDGWVPYGFLLPERGLPSLLAHVAGLLLALLAAGAVVWLLSRVRVSLPERTQRALRTAQDQPSVHP